MGITQIIPEYYEQVIPFSALPTSMVPGQIAWVPTCFIEHIPYVFEFERASPTDHYAINFSIRNMKDSDFKHKTKLPVKALNLNETEECLAYKAKKRPCILLAKNLTLEVPAALKGTSQKFQKGLLHDAALFLPLFGIDSPEHKGGIPAAMIDRIKVLMYEQFFYFKKGTLPKSQNFLIENSVGRFDRIFISTLSHPTISVLDGKLTQDTRDLVLASFARYLNIPLAQEQAETFSAILQLAQETLPIK